MAGGTPVSRTVAIYIDQAAAEQSAEKLRKKVESLEKTIRRGEQAGRDMSAQITQLGNSRNRLTELDGVISGRMTPSIRTMTAQVTKLRNELVNMSRDAPGYAAKFEAFRAASNRLNELNRELRGVEETMDRTSKPGFWGRMKQGIVQGLGIAGGFGIGAVISKGIGLIKEFVNGAVEAAQKFEALQVSFEKLLGSRSAANDMIRDLQKFSLATPFEFSDVAELTKQLLAFGFAQKDIIPTLDMLGNIASAVGKEKLPNLILAFSQVRMNGRLMAQDLNQLINAGFNPLEIISQKTGKSVADLRKDMENGLVSFAQVEDAFKTVTSEGGRFYNLMQDQSKTTSGALSNLKDAWGQFSTAVGMSSNGPLKSAYVMLGDFVSKLKEWVTLSPDEEVRKEQYELNVLVTAINSANTSQETRNNLIGTLRKNYPDFLGKLKQEEITTGLLQNRLNDVNVEYEKRLNLIGRTQQQEALLGQKQKESQAQAEAAQVRAALSMAGLNKPLGQISADDIEKLNTQGKTGLQSTLAKLNFLNMMDGSMIDADNLSTRAYLKAIRRADELEKKAQANSKITDQALVEGNKAVEEATKIADPMTIALAERQKYIDVIKSQREIVKGKTGDIKAFYDQKIKENELQVKIQDDKIAAIKEANKPKPAATAPVDKKAESAAKKAAREHAQAEKDVADLQFKLKQLQDDVKAASLDAEAGFEDKANADLQKISKKYEALIKEVKDRISKAAGLTPTEIAALNTLIQEYAKLEAQDIDNLKAKQSKDRDEKNFKRETQALSDHFNEQRQLAGQHFADGLLTEQQYKDALLKIDVDEAQSRVLLAQDYADNVKAAAEELEKAKTAAVEKGIKDRRSLEQREKDERAAALQLNLILAKKGSREEQDARIAIVKNGFAEQRKQLQANSAERLLLDAQEKEQLKLLDAEYWKAKVDKISEILNGIAGVFSEFMGYLNNRDDARLDKEKSDNDKKKDSYQRMLDNKQISQEQYNQYISDADSKMEKEEKEARKRQAKREKAAALFSAIINTAGAVAQALNNPWPLNLVLAAIAGAAGAVQIASIATQKEPQFAKGGIFDTTGGIADGPSHAEGGIGMYDEKTGKKVGEMEGNEAYMILSKKTTAANRDIIEKLLASSMSGSGERIAMAGDFFQKPKQIDYGNAIESISFTRHYRNGGVTQPAAVSEIEKAPAGSSSSDQQTLRDMASAIEKLNKRLDRPIMAQLTWTDIKEKQDQYEMLKKESSFQPGG
jgi:tape measure domain-containing protein